MAKQGNVHRILSRDDESRSFESYESLHKYCNRNGSKKFREYLNNCMPTATDAAGTAKAVASSTAVTNKGSTPLTLICACDADTPANRAMRVDIHYYTITKVKKDAYATTAGNATNEVAFHDAETGLVAVTDFYCFNQDDYGPVVAATTYGYCVKAAVAIGAVTNLCIGVAGAVAGIADPEICFAHVNTNKVYPLLADVYGVGQIWGERQADDVGDDGQTKASLAQRIKKCRGFRTQRTNVKMSFVEERQCEFYAGSLDTDKVRPCPKKPISSC